MNICDLTFPQNLSEPNSSKVRLTEIYDMPYKRLLVTLHLA